MGDIWKKVRSGERLEIPAAAHNAWMDAARAERNRQHDVAQDAAQENRQTTVVKVRNTSGADLDRFAVLALSDPIITPTDNLQEFKNRPNFTGVAPADPTKCKTYCILLEPLKNGRHRPRDRGRHHAGQGERDPGGRSVRGNRAGHHGQPAERALRLCPDPVEGIRHGREVGRGPSGRPAEVCHLPTERHVGRRHRRRKPTAG